MVNWHSLEKLEVIKELKSSERGLTSAEASLRLKKYGKNEIKEITSIKPFLTFLKQFKSVFIIILLLAALFSFFTKHYIDFAIIIVIVLINSIIGFFQEYRAEKTIKELKSLLVPQVRVLRNNNMEEIPSSKIVPGDILIVSEGEKIMADARIIHSNELQTNEAILTGESFPQNKFSEKIKDGLDIANRSNMLYMGTTITNGSGKAIVVSTGMSTEFGKIANLVQKVKSEKTPLEKKLDLFSRKIAVIILILAFITVAIGIWQGREIYQMLLIGTSLAVSVIPEGIPAVIAITLALAIKRMQTKNALIKKLPAAETLGRTTVICVDKTGTMTLEEMTVTDLFCDNKNFKIKNNSFLLNKKKINPQKNSELMALLKTGVLCNNARIEGNKIFGEPTEKALVISAFKSSLLKKIETEKQVRIKEYAFSSKRKMMSIVRKSNNELVSYVKGAPDVIIKHCVKELVDGKIIPLTKKRKIQLIAVYEEMAAKALRVLGFGFKKVPLKFDQNSAEDNLIFIGFQGMLDPPRKGVKSAIKECYKAGIKIKMLTGDSALTAKAIADIINLNGEVIEGHELERLSELEFEEAVKERNIFARITPELKFKIIKTLKKQKEVVAVTGDGVNDVLALKEAHIGIAMGVRGTDVARDVSDIILLDDNFISIVKAVKEGRRVYSNMKKSVQFHLAANVDELLVVTLALIWAMPLPLMPLAILWMNLITDSLPSLSLGVEKEDKNIMRKKPIDTEEGIITGIKGFIITAGIIAAIATLGVFILFYQSDLEKARTMALSVSVFCELFLVFTCRSDKNVWEIGLFSNKFLVYSVFGAFILQIIAIYSPLANVFGFKALSITELLICIFVSSSGLIFFEIVKMIKSKFVKV